MEVVPTGGSLQTAVPCAAYIIMTQHRPTRPLGCLLQKGSDCLLVCVCRAPCPSAILPQSEQEKRRSVSMFVRHYVVPRTSSALQTQRRPQSMSGKMGEPVDQKGAIASGPGDCDFLPVTRQYLLIDIPGHTDFMKSICRGPPALYMHASACSLHMSS